MGSFPCGATCHNGVFRYNREGYIKAMADMIAATCDKFEEPTKPVIFFSAHGVQCLTIS